MAPHRDYAAMMMCDQQQLGHVRSAPPAGAYTNQQANEQPMMHHSPAALLAPNTKGLLNAPGQNNCFLNSAVQVSEPHLVRRRFLLVACPLPLPPSVPLRLCASGGNRAS